MKSHIWHPNTQMTEWNNFPEISHADGVWLFDNQGNKLLDGVASMWCNVWGHSKKELVNTISENETAEIILFSSKQNIFNIHPCLILQMPHLKNWLIN